MLIPDPEEVQEELSHPPPTLEHVEGQLRHAVLDRDGDGKLTVDDIHVGLRDFLGLSVVDEVKTLAEAIYSCADVTGDGNVTVDDFEHVCTGMPKEYRLPRKWSNAFPDPVPEIASEVNLKAALGRLDVDSVEAAAPVENLGLDLDDDADPKQFIVST